MWVYVLIVTVFAVVPETQEIFQRSKVLNSFENAEACMIERTRVAKDMATSYPGVNDYVIECRKMEKTK
jgi:hypothetical protein